jgi:maleylacetoacetate isomerase
MPKLTLFDYFRSSASYRVRIALNLKGLAYESVGIDLRRRDQRSADYLARNPQGLVPLLEVDGRPIAQSLAIIDYLDAVFPEPKLVPEDPFDRAHVQAMALTIACDIHPLNNLRVLRYLVGPLGASDEAKNAWIATWIGQGFAAVERMASERAGRFLFGDRPTLADIFLVPQIYNARRFDVPLDDYPLLLRADAEAARLEPFAAAHPDRVAPADQCR